MLVALDFETTGLEMWSPKHEVKSVATATLSSRGGVETKYADTPESILKILTDLHQSQAPVAVYNVGFELMVLKCKFPDLKLNIKWDVMRLVQNYDNRPHIMSFGLKDAYKRMQFPDAHNWEEEAMEYLAKHKMKKSQLSELPRDILERYNVGDAVATLKIADFILENFTMNREVDLAIDHVKYMSTAAEVVESQIRGVNVDREGAMKYAEALRAELHNNEVEFVAGLRDEITWVEAELTRQEQAKYKIKKVDTVKFNIDSGKHRELLFTKALNLPVKYKTETGRASLKKSHLKQFGEHAAKLENRKNRQIVLAQLENLLELSEEDGKWHVSLKLCGTSTGRFAGGVGG